MTLLKRNLLIIIAVLTMVFLLAACGTSTLKDAQKAFDAGEYEQAVQIIKESGEDIKDNEELYSLYLSSYEKWAEGLVESGDCEKAIQIINDSEFELNDEAEAGLLAVYTDAWKKIVDQRIEEKNYYKAYDALTKTVDADMLSAEESKEKYYLIGEGFAVDKKFAPAGLAYAKAGDYQDAEKKCDSSWDKGAYRNTISIASYTAIGIKSDGTVASAKNDEWIEDAGTSSAMGSVRKNMEVKVGGWKDMISVVDTDYNCAGLTEKGTVKTSETGYYLWSDEDYSIDASDWEDIVSISMDAQILAGLDKFGKVHLAGSNSGEFSSAEEWTDIVDVAVDNSIIVGVDIFGNAHVINTNEGDADTWDPDLFPFEEKEFSDEDIKQFSFYGSYGVYVTADGQLKTTVNQDRADEITFATESGDIDLDIEDFQDLPAENGKGFVRCEAAYMNYVGLRNDGTVKVGGVMKEMLENFGVKKWKDIKEVHVGLADLNPVIAGVTSDGTLKLDGFEGGLYMPFHDRIRSWGKLRKPTIEYDTSEIK